MDMSARGWFVQPAARRFRVTAPIALVLHALLLAFLVTRRAPLPEPVVPASSEPIAVELDLGEARSPKAPPLVETPERAAKAARPERPRRAGVVRPPAPASTGDDGGHEGAGPGAPAASATGISAPPAAGESAVAPAPPADALPPPLLPRAVHAPRGVLEAPLATTRTSPDWTASAQVMGTVQRLANGAGAPRNAHGTVCVVIDEDGAVSDVTTTSASWTAVAKAIRAALAGRRFRVPKGAHGLFVSFAVDAYETSAPAVLTGEARAEPMLEDEVPQGGSRSHAPPRMAVIDPRALLPIKRHVVKVELLGEEPR
jgi:hypothetical protein